MMNTMKMKMLFTSKTNLNLLMKDKEQASEDKPLMFRTILFTLARIQSSLINKMITS